MREVATGRPGEAIFVVRRIVLAICADRAALGLVAALLIVAPPVCAKPVAVVAAENFYGDIARQIGGPQTAVISIISNPDKDPHEFEPGPASARMLAEAQLVIYNGADYDPWVAKLLSASSSPSVAVIDVAALANKKPGDNPHIWYDLDAVGALASHYVAALDRLDPAHAADYRRRLERFETSLQALKDRVVELRRKYSGTRVTATEPVFGYMADALGLDMQNRHFQLAVMNDTEPSASDIAAFEHDLRTKAVKLLIYNRQTSDALARRMRAIAEQSGVPVIGVTETEPAGEDYQAWMRSELDALDRALAQ
jgi:zinc/manganese transport system substrate-binding protein